MLPLSMTLPKINMNNFLSYQFVAKFYGNYDKREKSSKDLRYIFGMMDKKTRGKCINLWAQKIMKRAKVFKIKFGAQLDNQMSYKRGMVSSNDNISAYRNKYSRLEEWLQIKSLSFSLEATKPRCSN